MHQKLQKNNSISISKIFSFEYAHRLLLDYSSRCHNIHGHSGKLIINIETSENNIQKNGLLIDLADFNDIKQMIDQYDHCLLISQNDIELKEIADKLNTNYIVIPYNNTTMENILRHFSNFITMSLKSKILSLNKDFTKYKVTLTMHETDKNSCSYTFNM